VIIKQCTKKAVARLFGSFLVQCMALSGWSNLLAFEELFEPLLSGEQLLWNLQQLWNLLWHPSVLRCRCILMRN
jgi:hypothetical protein